MVSNKRQSILGTLNFRMLYCFHNAFWHHEIKLCPISSYIQRRKCSCIFSILKFLLNMHVYRVNCMPNSILNVSPRVFQLILAIILWGNTVTLILQMRKLGTGRWVTWSVSHSWEVAKPGFKLMKLGSDVRSQLFYLLAVPWKPSNPISLSHTTHLSRKSLKIKVKGLPG